MPLEEIINSARAYMDPKEVDVLIYHNPCCDGAGAALSAFFSRGESITYVPMAYQAQIDFAPLHGKNVMLVDICFPKDQLDKMRAVANKVMILDHHETALKDNVGEAGCFFEMRNAGAALAWYFFNGMQHPLPRFLRLIEDRDLWRWNERSASEPLFYALTEMSTDPDFRTWCKYLEEEQLNILIEFGKSLMQKNKQFCIDTGLRAVPRLYYSKTLDRAFNILAIELENSKLISELAEYLNNTNDVDFVMLWYKQTDGKFKVSLRNIKTEVNVATIARTFEGGGGHARAAGVLLDTSPWELLTPIVTEAIDKRPRLNLVSG